MRTVDSGARWGDPLASFSLGLFVIALVVGLITAGWAYEFINRQTPQYESRAVMLIDQPVEIATGNEGAVVKLNLLRPKYVALLTTSDVIIPAARRAGVSPAFMARSERPVAPIQSLTVLPVIRTSNRLLAQRMAQALAEELEDYVVAEQEDAGLPPAAQIQLRVIEDAHAGVKVAPKQERARQVGAVFGVGGLLVSYALLQLIRSRRP